MPKEYSSEHLSFLFKSSKAGLSVIYILGERRHPLHLVSETCKNLSEYMSKKKHIILPAGCTGKGIWMGEEKKGYEDWEGLFSFEVEEI